MDIGFNPAKQCGHELPVVADLSAANEPSEVPRRVRPGQTQNSG
jgi:hypothetical protein